jgi:hypothetical protein
VYRVECFRCKDRTSLFSISVVFLPFFFCFFDVIPCRPPSSFLPSARTPLFPLLVPMMMKLISKHVPAATTIDARCRPFVILPFCCLGDYFIFLHIFLCWISCCCCCCSLLYFVPVLSFFLSFFTSDALFLWAFILSPGLLLLFFFIFDVSLLSRRSGSTFTVS